jgi:peptide/nickel transport system permease protein
VLVFVAKRLVWAVLLVFVVTLITFVMFFVLPSNSRNVKRNELGFVPSLPTQFNAEGTFPEQYGHFLSGLMHGSLGTSVRSREPVTAIIGRTLPVTVSLIVGGVIFWILLAVPIGFLCALRPRSLLDKGLMLFVLLGVSAHPLWLGLMLSYLLGVRLHAFPVADYCDLFYSAASPNHCGGPKYWAYHLFLPWLTFALVFAALYARMIRAGLLEAMNEDYVRTARAKGASTVRVMRAHVFRNALLPVITMFGMDVGVAFGGALFTETAFQLPGMGRMLVLSLTNSDLPVIMGIVLVVSLAVIVANLLVDIAYALIDPRVRLWSRGDAAVVSASVRRELRAQARVTESATTR